jgi:hypothetical protein
MRPLPEGFSIVSDTEFAVLRHLPDFELTNADTLRRQVGEKFFFVCRESEWNRCEEIAAGVEAEILATDKANAELELQEIEAEIASKASPKQSVTLKEDQERLDRLFPLPNHPPSSRPPDWARDRFF